MEKNYLNTKEAANYLRQKGCDFKFTTLEIWRSQGKGPIYVKIGGKRVYYEKSDLDDFIKGEKIQTIDYI